MRFIIECSDTKQTIPWFRSINPGTTAAYASRNSARKALSRNRKRYEDAEEGVSYRITPVEETLVVQSE